MKNPLRILSSIVIGMLLGFVVTKWFCDAKPGAGGGEDWCGVIFVVFAPICAIVMFGVLLGLSSLLPKGDKRELPKKFQIGLVIVALLSLLAVARAFPDLALLAFYSVGIFISITLAWLLSQMIIKTRKYQIVIFVVLSGFFVYLATLSQVSLKVFYKILSVL
jgi:hypothetical protein